MEKDDLDFVLEVEPLTLREFAATAVAANPNIWNKHLHDIKQPLMGLKRRRFFFREFIKLHPEFERKFMEVYLLESNLKWLPNGPATSVKFNFLELCYQGFHWVKYMTYVLRFPSAYADKIYFTSKGVIDVSRIFRSYWIKIAGITPKGWFFQKFHPLHCLACLFDVEYFANHFQTDVVSEIATAFPEIKIDNNSDSLVRIMSILIYCFEAFLQHEDLTSIRRNLNVKYLTEIEMLYICMRNGFWKPFIFFYNQLDAIEEQNFLKTMSKHKYYTEGAFEILIFLSKKMNSFQRKDLISCNFPNLFWYVLNKETYQKLCISLLDKFFRDDNCYDVLRVIIKFFQQSKIYGLDSGYHLQVLQYVMKKIPKEKKIEIFARRSSMLKDLYDIFCIPALKIVFNDQDFEEEHKICMINMGRSKFKSMVMKQNYEELNTFAIDVLNSQILYDVMDNTFTYDLELWMKDYNFSYLENYLKWRYGDSAKEFKIQAYPLWCSLVMKELPNIKKLLEWCFDKMPTVKNCKDDRELQLLKEFCRELIYNIWLRSRTPVSRTRWNVNDTTKSINLSTEVLILIFISSEEVTKFIKTELVTDKSCVRVFCDSALKKYDELYIPFMHSLWYRKVPVQVQFEVVDKFFKCYELPTDKIKEIKESIAYDIEEWIEKYGTNANRFDVVSSLLDWVYGERAKNLEILT